MTKSLIQAFLLLALSMPAGANDADVVAFANQLKSAIIAQDSAAIRMMGCVPTPNQCFNQPIANYLFGSGEGTGEIGKFLNQPNVRLKVFGPYTYEHIYKNSSYVIVFFDPAIELFNENGFLKQELAEKYWNKGYVETVVTRLNGKINLNRTMFYYGAH